MILVIMCAVTGFVFLAYKDFEEYLIQQNREPQQNVIIISHIA